MFFLQHLTLDFLSLSISSLRDSSRLVGTTSSEAFFSSFFFQVFFLILTIFYESFHFLADRRMVFIRGLLFFACYSFYNRLWERRRNLYWFIFETSASLNSEISCRVKTHLLVTVSQVQQTRIQISTYFLHPKIGPFQFAFYIPLTIFSTLQEKRDKMLEPSG